MLRRLVVVLIIILIGLISTVVMIVFNADQNHSQEPKSVTGVDEEEFYPASLQKNFLLEDDITYEEVKKRKRNLEENFPNENTKYNLFAQNEKLLYKISKTFSGIVKERVPDTKELISAEGYPGSNKGKKEADGTKHLL